LLARNKKRLKPDDLPQYRQINLATKISSQACVQQSKIREYEGLSLLRGMATRNESVPCYTKAFNLLRRAVTASPIFLPGRCPHVDAAATANVD
jgi:hypothetical protein